MDETEQITDHASVIRMPDAAESLGRRPDTEQSEIGFATTWGRLHGDRPPCFQSPRRFAIAPLT